MLTLDANDPIINKLKLGINDFKSKKKYNKFSNTKTVVDGITFDSKKEAKRYAELWLKQKAGLIHGLILQPKFTLQPPFRDRTGVYHREISYIGDFNYFEKDTFRMIVEDCKGFKTDVYLMKKKMLLYKYPEIEFIET